MESGDYAAERTKVPYELSEQIARLWKTPTRTHHNSRHWFNVPRWYLHFR
jgi:hypothetical protein